MSHQDTKNTKNVEEIDAIARSVIGAAIEVHRNLEAVYEEALCIELELRGLRFTRQAIVEVGYKGRRIGEGRLDLLVEGCLVIELKSVETLNSLHTAQVLSYLKVTGYHLALLINFNAVLLKQGGIKRVVL
jgi:GxxExxY protein